MSRLRQVGAVVLLVVVFGGILFYEFAVWRECLSSNSWWFCLRVLAP